jgi:hypothetical protein
LSRSSRFIALQTRIQAAAGRPDPSERLDETQKRKRCKTCGDARPKPLRCEATNDASTIEASATVHNSKTAGTMIETATEEAATVCSIPCIGCADMHAQANPTAVNAINTSSRATINGARRLVRCRLSTPRGYRRPNH